MTDLSQSVATTRPYAWATCPWCDRDVRLSPVTERMEPHTIRLSGGRLCPMSGKLPQETEA